MNPCTPQNLRILGIDPGSRRVGVAYLDIQGGKIHRAEAEGFRFAGKDLSLRLLELGRNLKEWVVRHPADLAVVEEVFVDKGPRSSLILGMSRGVVLYILAEVGIPTYGISASRVKSLVGGYGRIKKDHLSRLLAMECSLPAPVSLDASDALAVAYAFHLELSASSSMNHFGEFLL